MTKQLGSIEDQRALSPLLIEGRTYRECMRLLGWPYGRVSEAARAIKGMASDSRDGRFIRTIGALARRGKHRTVNRRLTARASL